jgi:hypothetical protein
MLLLVLCSEPLRMVENEFGGIMPEGRKEMATHHENESDWLTQACKTTSL